MSAVNDEQVHAEIERLVAQEHSLYARSGAITAEERGRLAALNVQLDRLWDLLRQRRAREEFAQNPDDTTERPGKTVERYLQ